jgi:hypothetical protein
MLFERGSEPTDQVVGVPEFRTVLDEPGQRQAVVDL